MNGLKLNLGYVKEMIPGYINVDRFWNPIIKYNLESFPWPWEIHSVLDILLINVIEHLGKDFDVISVRKESNLNNNLIKQYDILLELIKNSNIQVGETA